MPGRPGAKGVLTPRDEEFSRWYQEVIAKAELAENGPVRGTIVIRPYGYGIWELLQAELNTRIRAAGAQNAYFPLLIPESYLRKEAEHVEGFSPELAVVTHGGGRDLEEPVVIRPTSETVINTYFSKWIQSYRDLPMCLNQWANVVRWELRPRLFLRTTEFLWQEGHTAHASQLQAREYALKILKEVYEAVMVDVMAVPVLTGRKTDSERFAGADASWTCEAMMGDGKALQMGTSHELGQNFARAFGTTYQSETGSQELVWQTSWGVSTRLIGALIMAHGDDCGLRLPPALAPIQVVVVVVRAEGGAGELAVKVADDLSRAGHRVHLDLNVATPFGRRAVDWELKGVPVRVEIGPRDAAGGSVTLVRRHSGEKSQVHLSQATKEVELALKSAHQSLFEEAFSRQKALTTEVSTISDARDAAMTGFARIPWKAVGAGGEAELAASGVTVRCLQAHDGELATDLEAEDLVAFVARAY